MLDFETIANAKLFIDPFPFLTAQNVLDAKGLAAVDGDFPAIDQPGIFPLSELRFGPSFAALMADIESSRLEAIIEEKFRIKLSDKPLMVTVRGFCRARDGRIHNDTKDKVVTCLLYLNPKTWNDEGGRLRLLFDDHDLENLVAEIPPDGGTFVAFRRTENSWHGHGRYAGPRRYVMFNWLASEIALARNIGRHKLSAAVKRIFHDSY